MALLVVALATTLASNLIWRQNLWLHQVETQRNLAQARLLAIAGIDWARAVLADDFRTNNYDHKGEPWATKVPAMPVEGGEIAGGIEDEQSKWNLNNLLHSGQINQEQLAVFHKLLSQLQLPSTLAESLSDWLVSGNNTEQNGGEEYYYLALKPAYRSAHGELNDIDNLLRVRGFDPQTVDRLRPYVSTLPDYTEVNVNTASTTVISAVLLDFPPSEIQRIITERDRIPFISMEDFKTRLPSSEFASLFSVNNLDTKSQYFSVFIHARYGNVDTSSTALLYRAITWPTVVWQRFE